MQELIKILNDSNGERFVSARELHKFLEIKTPFKRWINRKIQRFRLIENYDYSLVNYIMVNKNPKNLFSEAYDYQLSLEITSSLGRVHRTSKGSQTSYYVEGLITFYKKLNIICSNSFSPSDNFSNSTSDLFYQIAESYCKVVNGWIQAEKAKLCLEAKMEEHLNCIKELKANIRDLEQKLNNQG